MNTFTPFYIVSGALSVYNPRMNADRTDSLERWLRAEGFATVQVNGCYKGEREPAILVLDDRADNDVCEQAVIRLARQYDQESVLAVDANRQARLIFCAFGNVNAIGRWHAVNVDTVMNKPDASYTERAGQYYTVT